MRRRRYALLPILLGVVLAALAWPVPGSGAGQVSAVLPRPLRFRAVAVLGGVQAAEIGVSGAVPGAPVVLSGDGVAGVPGSVPAGDTVAVLWRGLEVGRAVAGADGSFRASLPPLPDGQVSLVYGPELPSLRPWVNVAACVWPSMTGGVSASGWYQPKNERPECLFDQCASAGPGSAWGAGYWGAGTSAPGWVARDFGREVLVRRVLVWPGGLSTENAWYRVDLSGPGGAWSAASGWIRNVGYAGRMEPGTVGWYVEVPGGFRASQLKLTADLSSNWTGVVELAALADLPLEEALGAPAWTLPGGEAFGSAPVLLVKPASWSGHCPPYWPDPDAWWVWCVPGANSGAPAGKVRFRVPFQVGESVDAILHVAADDRVTVWLDGVKILYWQAPNGYGGTPMRLSPGRHVLAFECENLSASPAGLLVTLRSWAGNVVLRSGGPGWETSGYVQ